MEPVPVFPKKAAVFQAGGWHLQAAQMKQPEELRRRRFGSSGAVDVGGPFFAGAVAGLNPKSSISSRVP